jgi:DNA replication initiation complex subunit (GINS family)
MPADAFSFETLSKQEAQERRTPKLTKLEARFWQDLRGYLDGLETEYLRAHADQPTARRTILLSDELRNAARKAEGLWEARQRKITLHALKNSRQAAPTQPENLTREEAPFYQRLTEVFAEYNKGFLRARTPREPQTQPKAKPAAPTTDPASKASPHTPADGEIATVRALVDVPPFVGLDAKTYKLKKGEVATLPRKMADILTKSGKVVPVA